MTFLPKEINRFIFSFLPAKELLTIKNVCKTYCETANELEKTLLEAKLKRIQSLVIPHLNKKEIVELNQFIHKAKQSPLTKINNLREELNHILQGLLASNTLYYAMHYTRGRTQQILGRQGRQKNLAQAEIDTCKGTKTISELEEIIKGILKVGIKLDEQASINIIKDNLTILPKNEINDLLEKNIISLNQEGEKEKNSLALDSSAYLKEVPRKKCNIM